MREQPIYQVSVHLENQPGHFERTFLFKPTQDDLIQVIQDRLAEVEEAVQHGDEEDAEFLSRDLESLQRLCEVAAAAKVIQFGESGTTINKVTVGGTEVGSIHAYRYTALDRPKRTHK